MSSRRFIFAAAVLALLSAGCAGSPERYSAPDFPAAVPGTVAVLPFDNESMSFQAQHVLRALVSERLGALGYGVLPGAEVDEKLHALGLTDGGQLGAYAPEKLGAALETDGLMYGIVEEFTYQNVGFFRKREVRLRLKLVHASRGARLWENVESESRVKVALSKERAGRSFIEGIVEQAAEGMLHTALQDEADRAVRRVLRNYPRRH
ncbi:MAG: GNA1162 family protein [Elusimicrobiota bacterium]